MTILFIEMSCKNYFLNKIKIFGHFQDFWLASQPKYSSKKKKIQDFSSEYLLKKNYSKIQDFRFSKYFSKNFKIFYQNVNLKSKQFSVHTTIKIFFKKSKILDPDVLKKLQKFGQKVLQESKYSSKNSKIFHQKVLLKSP